MRVLLIYPGWTFEYGRLAAFARRAGKWPPLNLAYLAAYAEELGHQAGIIDGEAEGLSLAKTAGRALEFQPDLVGITATTPFYHIASNLASLLKHLRVRAPIVVGGPHITVLRESAFFRDFDCGFIGEADNSWCEFLQAMSRGQDHRTVRGILFRNGEGAEFTGDSSPCDNMDSVPMPARHLLQNHRYRLGTLRGTKQFTSIMTTRGCPFRCIFCSTNVFGKNMRRRSPYLVVREMKLCIERMGVEHFMFADDTLTLNRDHILEICDRIIEERLNITFEGSTRANLVDDELIGRMVRAGLIRLSFGLESVDEEIRRTMRKMVPLESYLEANRLTNHYGIETLNSCMIGLPGETRDTVRKTLAFLRKSREIKQANISIAVPYPGTELFYMARRREMGLRLLTEDFSQYRRYNAAVMQVGDLSPQDLVEIQNEAFASIYLAWWRWWPMFRKSGFCGLWLTFLRLLKCLRSGKTHYLTNRQLKQL